MTLNTQGGLLVRSRHCRRRRTTRTAFCSLVMATMLGTSAAQERKLTAEQLVARHLSSIGTSDALAAARCLTASGSVTATFRMPKPGQLNGTSSILSDGRMLRFALMFAAGDYQGERLVFDGRRVDVGQIQLRVRSNLADFVYHYDVVLKEGLLGGTLHTAWPLLNLTERQPRLDCTGLKKAGGRTLYELRYRAKKDSGDVQVFLYFDPETFRHVYSEYRLVVRANMVQGTTAMGKSAADTSAQNDDYYKIQEWFDDFRTVDSLSLPHAYKLTFSRKGPSEMVLFDYAVTLTQLLHNREIDPTLFRIP